MTTVVVILATAAGVGWGAFFAILILLKINYVKQSKVDAWMWQAVVSGRGQMAGTWHPELVPGQVVQLIQEESPK
jgi:hypothetical protein